MLSDRVLAAFRDLGARPSASLKEREALRFLEGVLKDLGLSVSFEEFKAPATYTWAYLVFWLGLAQGGLLCRRFPLWSAASSGVLLVLLYLELATFPVVSRLFATKTSANVIGKYGDSPEVVLLAHVDSATPSIFFHPRFVMHPRASLRLFVASAWMIFGMGVLSVFSPIALWQRIAIIPSLYLLLLAAGHVHREFWMPPSPGGNDNASGVAASCALAEILKDQDIPFVLVLTGAEESGTWGALHFFRRHGKNLRKVPMVNLDNIGAGTLTAVTKEGMWRYTRHPQTSFPSFRRFVSLTLPSDHTLGFQLMPRPFLPGGAVP